MATEAKKGDSSNFSSGEGYPGTALYRRTRVYRREGKYEEKTDRSRNRLGSGRRFVGAIRGLERGDGGAEKSVSCRTNCVIALWRKENMERLQGSVACFWKTEAGH